MKLFIVRHAWAGQAGDPRYPDDELRPLTREGRQRFGRVVAKLAGRGFQPRLVATSPLLRCRQTAEIIASGAGGQVEIVEHDELRPGGSLEELLSWSASQEAWPLCWVGHAPDVELLAAALIGDGAAAIRFAKGAVAALRFDDAPAPGHATLLWLATAKSLGC